MTAEATDAVEEDRMGELERTHFELARDVFEPFAPDDCAALLRRVEALTTLALNLMAEVEALRQAHVADRAYRDAYLDTCLLTHNSAGPTSGWHKLLGRYLPDERGSDGRVWREAVMLERLGATSAEIEEFQRRAEEMEQYT